MLHRPEASIVEDSIKKCGENNGSIDSDKVECFSFMFSTVKKKIESKLLCCGEMDRKMLVTYFDELIKDFQKLQKLLSGNTMFMPSYDIKVCQESLNALQETIQKAQSTWLPKKRFSFRNKVKAQGSGNEILHSVKENSAIIMSELHPCSIKNVSNTNVDKYKEDIDKKDIGLHLLNNCKVCLYGAPSTLSITGVNECQIFSGPVSTSVYIENCHNCTFVIACQQLRVHNTSSCVFYLHVTSRSIIEDSSSLQFAPYNWSYIGQEKDFANAGLDIERNNWDAVDDFNWLVLECPSPNWSFLPKENYVLWR